MAELMRLEQQEGVALRELKTRCEQLWDLQNQRDGMQVDWTGLMHLFGSAVVGPHTYPNVS